MVRPPQRTSARLALIAVVSLALHAGLFLLTRHLPHPPPPKKKETISVVVREKPPEPPKPVGVPDVPLTPPPPKPMPQKQASKAPAPKPVPVPTPTPAKPPPEPVAQQAPPAPQTSAPDAAPNAPPGPPSAPKNLAQLNLFDPSAVGRSIPHGNPNLPPGDKVQGGGDDPNSPAAEKARVSGRLGQAMQAAMAGANVQAGFLASCDDGLDNNIDGEIDCADPGCRQLDLCDYTGVYEDHKVDLLPDGNGQAVARTFDVVQEGRVRKLSVQVNVSHASPGDLAITLIAPNGRRAELKVADRSDGTFTRAYYVKPFIGSQVSGRWTLRIEDKYPGVSGMLKSWKLFITS